MTDINVKVYKNELLREKYYKMTHPSGLDIYVFPKKLSSAYALFSTHYGSVDNTFGIEGEKSLTTVPNGIAHFLEHKLFANADGTDSFENFSAIGADSNAYTSFNKTAYVFSCTENFRESLKELVTFVTHPYFTDESISRERGIIAQEIKMYDDSPGESCYYGMLEGLYENHSIKKNICGSVKSIEDITPALLYECYRVFYNPQNMALIVCGDVDYREVYEIADSCLTKEHKDIKIIRTEENSKEPPFAHLEKVEKKMRVAKPIFNIGIKDTDIPKDPALRQKKDAAMAILNEILFSRGGELYSTLFESGLISPEMSYCYTINESFAFNSIAGESENPQKVLEIIKDYIKKVQKEGFSKESFERSKKVMYAEFVKEFDSTESIANNMISFVFENFDILDYANIILSTEYEEVNKLLESSFKDEFFTVSVVYPIDSEV